MKEITPHKNIVDNIDAGQKKVECLGCHRELENDWKFCPYCGLSTACQQPCPVCGKLIKKHGLINHIRLCSDEAHTEWLANNSDL
jgi:hypothetical protein